MKVLSSLQDHRGLSLGTATKRTIVSSFDNRELSHINEIATKSYTYTRLQMGKEKKSHIFWPLNKITHSMIHISRHTCCLHSPLWVDNRISGALSVHTYSVHNLECAYNRVTYTSHLPIETRLFCKKPLTSAALQSFFIIGVPLWKRCEVFIFHNVIHLHDWNNNDNDNSQKYFIKYSHQKCFKL